MFWPAPAVVDVKVGVLDEDATLFGLGVNEVFFIMLYMWINDGDKFTMMADKGVKHGSRSRKSFGIPSEVAFTVRILDIKP